MEEDVLSDVVPSNIVSRQVRAWNCRDERRDMLICLFVLLPQESEGVESEYVDEVEETDQLQSDNEAQVRTSATFIDIYAF